MKSWEIREQLSHPVLDCDGHWIEPAPVFLEFLRDEAHPDVVDRYVRHNRDRQVWYRESLEERSRARRARPGWWALPADTLDRATAMLPGLLYERAHEFGIDFALVYSSLGLTLFGQPDDEIRQAGVRALNRMNAELFAPYADRLTPVAVISTRTPQEALDELEFAVGTLEMKAIVLNGQNNRLSSHPTGSDPYIDTIGLDSPYDYSPLWARCVELGVAVTDHAGSWDSARRRSPSNYVFNHVGHFAEAMAGSAKALFLGGVTQQHPDLKFAFLEGGVGFACSLLFDLESHWEKRNVAALDRYLRPTNTDAEQFKALYRKYGNGALQGKEQAILDFSWYGAPHISLEELSDREGDNIDEFHEVGITSRAQLRAAFTRNFYFGCEPDDVMTALAFDRRLDTGLKPIFGSDIGHFDVSEMSGVLEEAYELVEHELITEEDFKKFTFSNGVELHTALNPHFFDGTSLEAAVAQERGAASLGPRDPVG